MKRCAMAKWLLRSWPSLPPLPCISPVGRERDEHSDEPAGFGFHLYHCIVHTYITKGKMKQARKVAKYVKEHGEKLVCLSAS
jgi:hypothetical protein